MKIIILAGGSGVRLWPVSRDLYPKSLLNLYNGQSLIQNIYKLALSLTDEKNIITVTNARLLNDTKVRLRDLCKNPRIISEPITKNTTNAIASALYFLKGKQDETVIILPVDFSLQSIESFQEAVKEARSVAQKGFIAAIGVKPVSCDVGFGYIQIGKKVKNVTPIIKFVEKPDIKTAESFIKSGDFYWNTGIYVAKSSVLLGEINKYVPNISSTLSEDMFDEYNKIDYKYYENLSEISIDYSVMEKTDKLAFVELKTRWSDYGSWQAIYNNSTKNAKGSVVDGNIITDNVSNSLVYSAKDLTAVSSVKDLIVVDTEDALLVCDKNRTADISKLVKKIKEKYDETTQISKTVVRPWGMYTCLNRGDNWLTKIITVLPGHKLSLQSHNYRSEHWVVLDGEACVVLENDIFTLKKGTSINIPLKAKHSLQNNTKEPLKILEVQKGSYIAEDDIIRYEDIYGRTMN